MTLPIPKCCWCGRNLRWDAAEGDIDEVVAPDRQGVGFGHCCFAVVEGDLEWWEEDEDDEDYWIEDDDDEERFFRLWEPYGGESGSA